MIKQIISTSLTPYLMAVLEALMSWRARWALPECSQTQSLTDFNEFGQQPLLVLAALHIHMTGFYQHKALSKGSVSRPHTWAFPGSRVWNWAVQMLELQSVYAHSCGKHPRPGAPIWAVMLEWGPASPPPEFFERKPLAWKETKMDLEMGVLNHSG